MPQKFRWPLTPVVVLALGLIASGAVSYSVERTKRAESRSRVENAVRGAHDRIELRLSAYEAVLRSTAALFAFNDPRVSRTQFSRFVQGADVQRVYPGIQGIGYVQRYRAEERDALAAGMRAEGFPEFKSFPEGVGNEFFAIVMIEPLDRRNRAAIGYDMMTDPVRREAMERARDTGEPAMSGKLTLIQEIDADKQAGFLVYCPVYSVINPPTLEERRRTLQGFVYAPFRGDDLFRGIFGTEIARVSLRVFDGPADDAAALLHADVLDPNHVSRFKTVDTLTMGGRTWTLEYKSTARFEEGSARPIVGYVMLAALGLTAVLTFLSLRQQKAAQAVEALAEELSEAVRVRDDFLSVAGHELKTPLAALMLQLQSMSRSAASSGTEELPAKARERIEKSLRQTRRLSALVEEVLDVSRLARGMLTVQHEPVDLAELCRDVTDRFAEQAAREGTRLELALPPSLVGSWDRVRLEQVVTNLISNALKYGAAKPVQVGLSTVGGSAVLVVTDHGIGIKPEDQDRIFGRFERAVSERNFGGLGLGLWISRQIVEALGGKIRCVSVPAQGSTFTVELPIAPL